MKHRDDIARAIDPQAFDATPTPDVWIDTAAYWQNRRENARHQADAVLALLTGEAS